MREESKNFIERLKHHPELYEKFKELLEIVENTDIVKKFAGFILILVGRSIGSLYSVVVV
jgi:hypothetical protein